MHSKLFSLGLGLFIGFALPACGSNDNKSVVGSELPEDAAKEKASTYVPGAVSGTERIATPDEDRWAVTVAIPGGGEAVVEFERTDGRLAEINSDKAPF